MKIELTSHRWEINSVLITLKVEERNVRCVTNLSTRMGIELVN